jgi:hypothetical protein
MLTPPIMLRPVQLLSTNDMTPSAMLQGPRAADMLSQDEPTVKLMLLHNTQPLVRTVTGWEIKKAHLPSDVMLVCRMFHTLLVWTVTEEILKASNPPAPPNAVMLVWRMFHTLLVWTVMGEERIPKASLCSDDMVVRRIFHKLLLWTVTGEEKILKALPLPDVMCVCWMMKLLLRVISRCTIRDS